MSCSNSVARSWVRARASLRWSPLLSKRTGGRTTATQRQWVQNVVSQHPDTPTILLSHDMIERNALWQDYQRGRLEAVLLEGGDLDVTVRSLVRGRLGAWGVSGGVVSVGAADSMFEGEESKPAVSTASIQ